MNWTSLNRPAWLIVLAVALAWAAPATAQMHAPIEGAWVVQSYESADGETLDAQPGLYIFTRTHYSTMFVPGSEPRAGYEDGNMTDEDRLAAYGTIIANSGRYEVDGNEVTTRAYVAKDPNYMGAFPDNTSTYTFRVEDDTLYLTFANGSKATLRQVDNQPAPF
ncbi:MAG: hypothetical protein BMS9Abin29_0174 [Gemmatimonadota bacterium]|nr:MAG: hypothetical protein BMS9Abin29_0174 [Gemmatimonadota bacterium]